MSVQLVRGVAVFTGSASPVCAFVATGNLDEPLLLTDMADAATSASNCDPWGNMVLLSGGAPLDLQFSTDSWKRLDCPYEFDRKC